MIEEHYIANKYPKHGSQYVMVEHPKTMGIDLLQPPLF